MDPYPIAKFMHVVCALVWLGGGLVLLILGTLHAAKSDAERVVSVLEQVSAVGNRVFMPASVLTLLTGLLAVWLGGHGWPAWVVLALAGIAFTALFGALKLGPMCDRTLARAREHGARAALGDANKLLRLAKFDSTVLFAIVFLMVIKPGWDEGLPLGVALLAVVLGALLFLLPVRRASRLA